MPALLFEVRNRISYPTARRCLHNSLNPELIVQLAKGWKRVNEDDDIRVAIITGAGDKSFSAGADLARMIPLLTGARKAEGEWDNKRLANRRQGEHALLCSAATTSTNRSSPRSTVFASRVASNSCRRRTCAWPPTMHASASRK
jgi:enoyl-CoA hydratase/carnithine racemase